VGEVSRRALDILAELPTLPTGEAFVWAPEFPEGKPIGLQRTSILRETYDSASTPKVGEQRVEPKELAPVDLERLRERRWPRRSRRRRPTTRASSGSRSRNRALAALGTIQAAFDKFTVAWREDYTAFLADIEKRLDSKGFQKILDKLASVQAPTVARQPADTRAAPPSRSSAATRPTETRAPRVSDGSGLAGLDDTQQRILDVVAMLEVRGIEATRDSVARWQDLHPSGGRYGTNLGVLRRDGYLEGFTLTAKGRAAARPMATGFEAAKAPLDETQRTILDVLANHSGRRFSRDTLAAVLGLHPSGGRYGTNLGRLRTMGLIPERGDIYLTEGAKR
jgi:hypothetical protein